jgi:hypothetical protein
VGAPSGTPAADQAIGLPPLAVVPFAVVGPGARAGASATALADGSVLIVGGTTGVGSAAPEAELYDATRGVFVPLAAQPSDLGGRRVDHAAVRLDDGAVLIIGGKDAGDADVRSDVVLYRHDPVGPWSSVAAQTFAGDAPLVVPNDPSHATFEPADASHAARLTLTAGDLRGNLVAAFATLAGPLFQDVRLDLTLGLAGPCVGGACAGVAVLVGMTSPGDYVRVSLTPGEEAHVQRVVANAAGPALCTGAVTPDLDDTSGAHTVTVERRADKLTVTVDGASLLTCADIPAPRGAAAVALTGPPGDALHLVALQATR